MSLSRLVISLMKSVALAGTESWGSAKDQDAFWVAPLGSWYTLQRIHSLQYQNIDIGHFSRKRSVGSKEWLFFFVGSWLIAILKGDSVLSSLLGINSFHAFICFVCVTVCFLESFWFVGLFFFFVFFLVVWLVLSERKTRSCSKFLPAKRSMPKRKYWNLQENFVY